MLDQGPSPAWPDPAEDSGGVGLEQRIKCMRFFTKSENLDPSEGMRMYFLTESSIHTALCMRGPRANSSHPPLFESFRCGEDEISLRR